MTTDATTARDDRKSAALADRHRTPPEGVPLYDGFPAVREVLRNPAMHQAGIGADRMKKADPRFVSVFFLDGEEHRRRRSVITKFFTPKAISTRHTKVMVDNTDRLLAKLQADGKGRLDTIAFELAVAVAAEIVGLTESETSGMARRINSTMVGIDLPGMHPLLRPLGALRFAYASTRFLLRDVRPSVKRRRAERRDDILSQLIDRDYPMKSILIEMLTYANAGMVTTREFIVMAAWHLFDNDDLRQRFLDGTEREQLAILEEVIRLEPVVDLPLRRAAQDTEQSWGPIPDGELVACSLRDANTDESTVGACPHAIDPERPARTGIVGGYLSFGDGSHRCPGANLALAEARVFLDRLFRVPGIRLQRPPDMGWNKALAGYELRRAVVSCDRV